MKPLLNSVSHHQPRHIGEIKVIESISQLQGIIKWCNSHQKKFSVYSTGCSWGLGSRFPVQDVDILLDLGQLNKIRDINLNDRPYTTIETGVSQGKLCDALADTSAIVNLSSAGPNAGIVSNALERGMGFHGAREADLLGLEIITPDGNLAHIGINWQDDKVISNFKPTLGSDYQNCFLQSNKGIVTAAGIRLRQKPESAKFLVASIPAKSMPTATCLLANLRWQNHLDAVPKLLSPTSIQAYSESNDSNTFWSLITPFFGDHTTVKFKSSYAIDKIKTLDGISDIHLLSIEEAYQRAEGLGSACDTYLGKSSSNAVKSIIKTDTQDADQLSENGILFSVFTANIYKNYFTDLNTIINEVNAQTGVTLGPTINIIKGEYFYTNFLAVFPREDQAAKQAHQAFDVLLDTALKTGWYPHRLDIDRQLNANIDKLSGMSMKKNISTVSTTELFSAGRYGG